MNRIFFLIISALALTSCASTGIKTDQPLPQSYKYSKVEYRSEMQQYFKKELPGINDPIFDLIQFYYDDKVQTEEQFKKACKNASIAIKAVIMETGGQANNLYIKSLMSILDNKGKQNIKDQILLESDKYDRLDK